MGGGGRSQVLSTYLRRTQRTELIMAHGFVSAFSGYILLDRITSAGFGFLGVAYMYCTYTHTTSWDTTQKIQK